MNDVSSEGTAIRDPVVATHRRHEQSYSIAMKGVSLGTNIVAIAQGMYFMNMDR